jgi:4-hydroxy-4-methyl-2-oxoglutarate aldolase
MKDKIYNDYLRRYRKLYLPAVTDILDKMGYTNQWLGKNIKPIGPVTTIAGEAFTVKYVHSLFNSVEDSIEGDTTMLEKIRDNNVIVVDNGGNELTGLWGGMSALIAKKKGAQGLVIDGAVRDTSYIIEQELPIYARFTSPLDSLGRFKIIDTNVPISINNITINPGDIIMGDYDGVISIPIDIAEEVLFKAEKLVENETNIRNALKSGMSPKEAGKKYGHF